MGNQNKLWYNILPGGNFTAFATKGRPDDPVGYIQPAIRAMVDALQDQTSKWSSLITSCGVRAVLPIRNNATGQAKYFHFDSGRKWMNVSCIVGIRDNTEDNMKVSGDAWCNHLVRAINTNFDVKIAYGGNAARYGMEVHQSLDSQFLTDDVANLALLSYQDLNENGSFFEDDQLVFEYFVYTPDVQGFFKNLFANWFVYDLKCLNLRITDFKCIR